MEKLKRFLLLVFVAAIGGFMSLGAFYLMNNKTGTVKFGAPVNARATGYDIKTITVPTFDFADVSEAVTPTVVYIKTKIEEHNDGGQRSQRQVNPFDELFGNPFGGPIQRGPQEASGSGVIISDKGYIITNNHVVKRASTITVKLFNGKAYEAALVASDSVQDLALLRLKDRHP